MSPEIEETPEGFVARCRAADRSFSFLVGQGPPSISEVKGNHVFVTRGSHAAYMLQVVCIELTDELASYPEDRDLEILAAHYRWERQFQEEAGTQAMDIGSARDGELRTGERYLAWGGQVPADSRERFDERTGKATSAATPFSGFASVRNSGELIFFGVQGLGLGWSPEGVRVKAMRIASSVCFGEPEPAGSSG